MKIILKEIVNEKLKLKCYHVIFTGRTSEEYQPLRMTAVMSLGTFSSESPYSEDTHLEVSCQAKDPLSPTAPVLDYSPGGLWKPRCATVTLWVEEAGLAMVSE